MNKTEYRLIPVTGCMYDLFLQFKTVEVRRGFLGVGKPRNVNVWRFIPTMRDAILGYSLAQHTAPSSMWDSGLGYIADFYQQETYTCIPFTKEYPDIEVYFRKRREKHQEYCNKQDEKSKLKVKYL